MVISLGSYIRDGRWLLVTVTTVLLSFSLWIVGEATLVYRRDRRDPEASGAMDLR
jgi:hypothetical protein